MTSSISTSFSCPLESKHGKLLFHSYVSKLLTVKVFLTSVFLWWALWFPLGTQNLGINSSRWPNCCNGAPTRGRGWGQVEPSSFYSRCHRNSWSNSLFSSVEITCLGTLWFPMTSSQHQEAGEEQMWRQRVSNSFWPQTSQEISLGYYHHSYVFCFLSPPS